MSDNPADTPVPDRLESSAADEPPLSISSQVRADVAGLSHAGLTRPNNEDHFLIGRFGRFLEILMTNVPPDAVPSQSREQGYAMVVADGMGGYTGGEVASRLAIQTLIHLVLHIPDWILRVDQEHAREVLRRATQRFREVDLEIGRQAQLDPKLARMGTTMTVAHSLGLDLFVAHVGDSRAYLFRQGSLLQLTHDQTMGQTLVDMGVLSREEGATTRLRHALTQALGKQGGNVRTEVHRIALHDGDCLLLCTDGLTEMVDEASIADALQQNTSAADTCRKLIDLALKGGGRDNITVIVARYQYPDDLPVE